MRRLLIAVAVLAWSLPGLAGPARADGRFVHRDGRFDHRDFHRRSHDRFDFDFFVGGPVYGPPVYAAPVYYPPPAYYPPPVYPYAPPAVVYGDPPMSGVVVREGRDSSGNYCREYQNTSYLYGRTIVTYSTACLRPDGLWQIVG